MALSLDGTTMLITGASSGIGRAIARLAAGRAKTLALVARRSDRLEALRDELLAAHPALKVQLFVCDLSNLDETARLLDEVAAEVGEVDVLINNAGVGEFGAYDQMDWRRIGSMLTLNVSSLALLTHRLVGPMVARGRGGVLNISSGFGLGFSPGFAAYVGSKHFVTGFTEALRLDLSGTGVAVTQVCPGPVRTEFAARVGYPGGRDPAPGIAYISDEKCARAALRGLERDRAMVVPGLVMKLLYLVIALSPRPLMRLTQIPLARAMRRRLALAAAEPPRLDAPK
ncbi:MAG TPA: SDR family oxidoreductase [Polyangia bacterium]|jgi:hypothetical protein